MRSLQAEMKRLAKKKKFEEAARVRNRIYNLRQVMAHAHVIENSKFKIQNSKFRLMGRIEAYDVSNIQGKYATGSMVVFTNGAPDKKEYKKFKIKISGKPNDIAMLREVLQRRFAHAEWGCPDIILIDGGRAQLNVALKIKSLKNSLKIVNCKLKILAFAKGRQELFIEGRKKPTPIKSLAQKMQNLILHLNNEAHRFAISYHKKLRKQSFLA